MPIALPREPKDMTFRGIVEHLRFLARAGLTEGESLTKMEDALDQWLRARDLQSEKAER